MQVLPNEIFEDFEKTSNKYLKALLQMKDMHLVKNLSKHSGSRRNNTYD